MAVVALEVVLSPAQLAAAQTLCAGGATTGPALFTLAAATPSTLEALTRLGVIDCRRAGAREPLYHLTSYGRELVCVSMETESDDLVGPYTETEVPTMNATDTATKAKPDPKPSAAKKPAKDTKPAAAAKPPVEDVTSKPDEPVVAAEPKVKKTQLARDLAVAVLTASGEPMKMPAIVAAIHVTNPDMNKSTIAVQVAAEAKEGGRIKRTEKATYAVA